MEQETRGRRQVDLFNFSFLDILACVIGLLIFILTIVVISGGGSSSPQRAARMTQAERQLSDARAAAALAQDRRVRAEAMLGQRADQANDPVSATASIRKETAAFSAEAQALAAAITKLDTRLAQMVPALDVEKKQAVETVARAQAAAAQARDMEQHADSGEAQLAQARASRKPRQEVRFYVPRVRESERKPILVELSGERVWFLDSRDYRRIPIDADTSRVERLDSAAGTSVAAFIDGSAALPAEATSRPPGQLMFSVALRPDGFAAFRKFRDWAWEKGYGVNWMPIENSASIVIVTGVRVFEQ